MTAIGTQPLQRCPRCDQHLPLDAFCPSRQGKVGVQCRACTAEKDRKRNQTLTPEQKAAKTARVRTWRENNPRQYQNGELLRLYGITLEQYEAKLAEQGGVCGACRQPETRKKKSTSDELCPLHVDHCHETGRFRGLLCSRCNLIAGHAHDDVKVLLGVADYLERSS